MEAPLTAEEAALLDALDEAPRRTLDLVRAKLPPIAYDKTRRHIEAALDALQREIERDGLDDVEARHSRSLAKVAARLSAGGAE